MLILYQVEPETDKKDEEAKAARIVAEQAETSRVKAEDEEKARLEAARIPVHILAAEPEPPSDDISDDAIEVAASKQQEKEGDKPAARPFWGDIISAQVEAKFDEQNINLNHNEIPNNRFKIMLFSMFSSKI